jgi:SLAP domain-containing protein
MAPSRDNGVGTQAATPDPFPPVSGQLPSTVVLPRSRVPAAFWTLLVLLVAAVAVVGAVARSDVVRFYPPAIDLYAGVGLQVDRSVLAGHPDLQPALALEGVETAVTEDGDLTLSGSIVNTGTERRRLRPLDLALRDADGAVLARQEIALDQLSLEAGDSLPFEVAIAPWPDGAVEAQISLSE